MVDGSVRDAALAGLDGPVRTLFAQIAAPAAAPTPDLGAIGAALLGLAEDLDYLARWVERLGDESGSLPIHAPARGPRLMIVHRARPRWAPSTTTGPGWRSRRSSASKRIVAIG